MARWIDRNALTPKEKVRLWVEEEQLPAFRSLCGRSVVRWVGNEIAVREQGPSGAPVFHDPAIPYLQVCPLYLEFAEGLGSDINTYDNSGNGCGLRIDALYGRAPSECSEEGSIYRTRVMDELPTGRIEHVHIRQNERKDIVDVSLDVDGRVVSLWSGEVYEEPSGLRVVWEDEHVLIAVTTWKR